MFEANENFLTFSRDDSKCLLPKVFWGRPGNEDQTRRRPVKFIKKIRSNEEGATAIEYGLIAALIAVAAITAMQSLGNNLSTTFNKVSTNMTSTTTGG